MNSLLKVLVFLSLISNQDSFAATADPRDCSFLLSFIGAKKPIEKLFWLDLETGGLDEFTQPIIEVGAIVTDAALNEIARHRSVIYQPPEIIQAFEPAALEMHQRSGLIGEVASGKAREEVEREIAEFIKVNFHMGEDVILAGNSVHFDRAFLRRHMPLVYQRLFYRQLDVSSLKIAIQLLYGIEPEKPKPHLALDDLDLSIRELKTYFQLMKEKRYQFLMLDAMKKAL